MGTNPGTGKMPNRGLGRQIGSDDSKNPEDINVQEISTDTHTGNTPGGGTNFQHQRKDRKDATR